MPGLKRCAGVGVTPDLRTRRGPEPRSDNSNPDAQHHHSHHVTRREGRAPLNDAPTMDL
jgi:hypothetical protein